MPNQIQYICKIIESNIGVIIRKLFGERITLDPISFISIKARLHTEKRTGYINIGRKTCVRAGSELHADGGVISLANGCFVNRNCTIVSHKEIAIGGGTTIGPNVCIYDHDHDGNGGFVSSAITIGRKVW